MDEYKPINVHGILLTAVHDGGTGEEYCRAKKNHRIWQIWRFALYLTSGTVDVLCILWLSKNAVSAMVSEKMGKIS